jgi:rhodanese-related sulfurtransferase
MSRPTPEITLEEFAAAQQDGTTVDVRERGEYAQGHVPGAVLVPMSQLASRLGELDRSSRIHVICASGNRSKAMTDLLVAQGFDAVSIAGGAVGVGL